MKKQDNDLKERRKHGALFWFIISVISSLIFSGLCGTFYAFAEMGMYDSTRYFRKNVNDLYLKDYAVYALSDYQDDFGMNELKNTNFRYGVYSTDEPALVDLRNRSSYEVCNLPDDVLAADKSELFRYSATLGDYSVFVYNTESIFDPYSYITNYSSYDNIDVVQERHSIAEVVYIWNTDLAYVITADGFYFPVGITISYDDGSEEWSVRTAVDEKNSSWNDNVENNANIVLHSDNGETYYITPWEVTVCTADYLSDLKSGIKYNFESYESDFQSWSMITSSTAVERPVTGKDCYLIACVAEPLDYECDDLFARIAPWIDLACSTRYLVIVLTFVFGILTLVSVVFFCIRFFAFIAKGFKKLGYQCKENIRLTWRLIGIASLCTLAEFIVLVSAVDGSAEDLIILGWLVQTLVLFPLFVIAVLQLNRLAKGAKRMAEGNLESPVDTKHMFYDFKTIGDSINSTGQGLEIALADRMKSERFKTELISNVSHDIKTPLTSIISYVELLKEQPEGEPANREYLETLERQSVKLKKLLEDLIEASKASTGNLKAELEPCNVNTVLHQVIGEYQEKLSASELDLRVSVPEEPINIMADTRHFQRVLDNLFVNVSKYAQPGTRVYVNLSAGTDEAAIEIKNTSKESLNMTSDELLERFTRGDSSRGSEGNGLGLSIAQSLMELMNGKLKLVVDGDLFKVILLFPRITE
ncbi:MAG: HAMP domain-containing histidine kinase [Lachnospiraceae bacterium]|nr:HAMP domain-containing histidine kinase [Lachnospiraceae bacterium]